MRIGSELKSPRSLIPENSMMSFTWDFTSAGDMPIARQPSTTLRSPGRSFIRAALTPSSDGWLSRVDRAPLDREQPGDRAQQG
nr:hypothetical protein GCM10020092_103590 [Actinoplanes digitatis]